MNQAFYRIALCGVLAGALICGGLAASAQQTTTKKKTTAKKKVVTKSGSSKASAVKKKSTGKKTASAKKSAPKQGWRSRQLSPEPQRYQEIQSALAEKGYFKGTPTGVWDSDSQAALRRFQSDQNLEPTGKLDSLSLMPWVWDRSATTVR